MSKKKVDSVTTRDLYARLVETVGGFLGRSQAGFSLGHQELSDAYEAVMADPLVEPIAAGDSDQVTINLPRGSQITIIGPAAIEFRR